MLILCGVLVLSSSIPVLAVANDITDSNILKKPEDINVFDQIHVDSLVLEHGTMYLEENAEYRIAYIVYNEGHISYSICYRDNPTVVHNGWYYPNETRVGGSVENNVSALQENAFINENIVNVLLDLEPQETINFGVRLQSRATILTENDALNFASNYGSGWKTPVTSKLLGQHRPGSITVSLYENVRGSAKRDNIAYYYAGDTLTSLASLFFKLNLSKIMKIVTNAYNGTMGYIAQTNGTLTYFTVDNTRTKTARINGTTYYWSGWDREYAVFSGDKSTQVELGYDYANPEYSESITYFGEKALANYN